jgi:hypothetical protein
MHGYRLLCTVYGYGRAGGKKAGSLPLEGRGSTSYAPAGKSIAADVKGRRMRGYWRRTRRA